MLDKLNQKLSEIEDHIAPGDWQIDEKGVWRTRDVYKRGKLIDSFQEIASPIPVVPTSILKNMDTHTEKLELSFLKHKRWETIVTERSVTANRNAIIKLADKGLEVNSDNAGTLVKYIAEVVAASLYCLPHKPAKSVMGWVDDEFMPYTDKVVFDGDDQFSPLYKAIAQKGRLNEWADFVRPLRDNLDMRLCMAASFASPLIEIIGENPFVFHLWGGTGSGKTVSTMVAMSIWGDPAMGKLTRTMNMTANAMLSTAAFLRNLPFAGDELQTIKSRWQNYDNLIMKITEGVDRGRMSYDRVNETRAWKCSFIFTGEEPCIKQASGGGAKNRVIEVECKNKIIENGNAVANFVRTHYGTAGEPYIRQLTLEPVADMYSAAFEHILKSTDTTDKQAGSMALMLAADRIASQLFWPGERPLSIAEVQPYLASASEVDVAERAYQYMLNAIAENSANFTAEGRQNWGSIQGDHAFINKNVLTRVMEEQGFDFDAVKSKWAERERIELNSQGRYIHQRTINGARASFVKISLNDPTEIVQNDELDQLPF